MIKFNIHETVRPVAGQKVVKPVYKILFFL